MNLIQNLEETMARFERQMEAARQKARENAAKILREAEKP